MAAAQFKPALDPTSLCFSSTSHKNTQDQGRAQKSWNRQRICIYNLIRKGLLQGQGAKVWNAQAAFIYSKQTFILNSLSLTQQWNSNFMGVETVSVKPSSQMLTQIHASNKQQGDLLPFKSLTLRTRAT